MKDYCLPRLVLLASLFLFIGGCSDLASPDDSPKARVEPLGPSQTTSSLDIILNELDELDSQNVVINNVQGREVDLPELKRLLKNTSSAEPKATSGFYSLNGYSFIRTNGSPPDVRTVVFELLTKSSEPSDYMKHNSSLTVESTGFTGSMSGSCSDPFGDGFKKCRTTDDYQLFGRGTTCTMNSFHEGEPAEFGGATRQALSGASIGSC